MLSSTRPEGGRRPADRLRSQIVPWAWTVLALLLVQNVLGIYLNLYVPLPPSNDLAILLASYSVLAMHVAVGFLILGATGVVLFLAARTRRVVLWAPALGGLAFALLAFSSGVEFTIGGQDDLYSFIMEILFLGVVGADVLVLYAASRPHASPEREARSSVPARE